MRRLDHRLALRKRRAGSWHGGDRREAPAHPGGGLRQRFAALIATPEITCNDSSLAG